MKNNGLLATVFLIFTCPMLFSQGIHFENTDWKTTVSRAKTAKKMIFVDFYTTWCAPCKRLEKEVFTLPEVGSKFNNSFINLRIDAEKGEGIALAAQFGVSAYPTSLFIKAEDESLVYKIVGFLPAEKYLVQTDDALEALIKDPFADLEFEYQKGNRTPPLLTKIIAKKLLFNRAVDRELTDYFVNYSVDSFFANNNDRFYRDIRMDINGKALDLFMQRIKQINQSAMFTLNSPIKLFAEKSLLKALEKAKQERNEAHFERILTYISYLWTYKNIPDANAAKYKMLFYQHGGNPDKLVESTENYLKVGHLMRSTTVSHMQSMNESRKDALEMITGDDNLSKTITQDSAALTKTQEQMKKMPPNTMNKHYAKEFASILQPYLSFVNESKAFKTATKWSKRMIELEETAHNLSIHAQIMFKSGNKSEGIAAQKKAIELAKQENVNEKDLTNLQAILKKMED